MNKRLLMVAHTASMIDQFCMDNINFLLSKNVEVFIAANFTSGNTSSNERLEQFKSELNSMNLKYFNIGFPRNPFKIKDNIKSYRQIKKLINDLGITSIHCTSPVGGVISRLANIGSKAKIIYSAHGFHFFKGAPLINWLLYYPLEKILARFTDCLITTNKEDYFIAKKKFKTKVLFVNGVGVKLDKFIPQSEELKSKYRSENGYSKDDFILIYPAEMSKRKNQQLLLKVISKLKPKISDLKLVLLGKGAYMNKLKEEVTELGIEENVDFLGFRTDIEKLITMADIAVSSSRQEGLPVNVIMAMAIGLSCVVTDCRGNNDLIKSGINGFTTGLEDVELFSKYVLDLYNSKDLRDKYGKVNLEKIKDYSTESILNRFSDIYGEFVLS